MTEAQQRALAARIEAGLSTLDAAGNERPVPRVRMQAPTPPRAEPREDAVSDVCQRLLAKHTGPSAPSSPAPTCGAAADDGDPVVGRVYCRDGWHSRAMPAGRWDSLDRCPEAAAESIRARVTREQVRLAGPLARIARGKRGTGWEGFDDHEPTAALALATMRRFAAGRPPERSVYLRGGMGTGKTRLMMAAYFDLLTAGVDSRYVTPGDLRRVFRDATNFDDAVSDPARAAIVNLKRAKAILLDDIGLVGDERFSGEFREGLKDILDATGAVFAIATNLSAEQLERHPDVGPQNFSRLVEGAEVVVMTARDDRRRRVDVLGPAA